MFLENAGLFAVCQAFSFTVKKEPVKGGQRAAGSGGGIGRVLSNAVHEEHEEGTAWQ